MRRELTVPVLVATLAAASAHSGSAQVSPPTAPSGADAPKAASLALVESWPDGRVNYALTTTRRASMWTPNFVRLEDFTPPQGRLPAAAVQIVRWAIDTGIHVEVSVLMGSPQPPGELILSADMARGQQVIVEALTGFGIKPIALSVVDVHPLSPYLPTVTSITPLVEISDVRVVSAPYPGYHIALRNLGSQAVTSVRVQSYRGSTESLSSLQRAPTGRPLMSPGDSAEFDMFLTSGPTDPLAPPGTWSPVPLDVIEIQEVRWANGTSDGASRFPGLHEVISSESGQRVQLQRIVRVLEATLADRSALVTSARARIEGLPDDEPDQLDNARVAMQMTKAMAMADLSRFERDWPSAGEAETRAWLSQLLARYRTALARISPP